MRHTHTVTAIGAMALLSLSLAASPARAHFYWAQIAPGSPPMFRLAFTERPAEATLPNLLDRIGAARARTGDGTALTLKRGAAAMEAALPAGTRVAGVEHTWGVLDRNDGSGVFLLQYYAKATQAGAAAETANLHVEVFARREGEEWVVSVKHGRRGEKGAELTIYRPGEREPLTLTTDDRGEVRFQATKTGLCAIRARAIEIEKGEFDGKSYAQKRYYSTLTFPIPASAVGR